MTTLDSSVPALDRGAVRRWPQRAAAHCLGIGLVAAVVLALPDAPSDLDRHQFPKETATHLAVFLAVVLARPWPAAGTTRAIRWLAVAVAGWAAFTAVFATNPWLAFRAVALSTSGMAALLTARHVAAHGGGRVLLAWAALAAGLGAATGLAQAFGVEHPFFAELRAPGGSFGNRNFLAHLAAIALPTLAMLILTARRVAGIGLGAVAMAACAAALVLTRSRAGWLAAGAGLGILVLSLLVAHRRAGRVVAPMRLALVGLMLAGGLGVALILPNTLEWRSDSPYSDTLGNLANFREGSGRGRMLQYQNSLELALRHPLVGVGPGNWPLHYGDVAPRNDPSWVSNDIVPLNPWPSSDWVALVSERGFVAVALSLLLGLALAWRGWLGVAAGGPRAGPGGALGGTLAAVAVTGAFDAVLLLAVPTLFAAVACGALLHFADGEPRHDPVPSSAGATVLAVVVALGLARSTMQLTAYLVAGDGSSRTRMERAAMIDPFSYHLQIALGRRGPCRDARDHARAALRLAPTWAAPRRAVGRCPG